MPQLSRYIGIDYSGAQTPTSSLKGLRVYAASRDSAPVEVRPPPSVRRYWTRGGVAEWLVERLLEDEPTLVGIDHGFSFPVRYFEAHQLPLDWSGFLEEYGHRPQHPGRWRARFRGSFPLGGLELKCPTASCPKPCGAI